MNDYEKALAIWKQKKIVSDVDLAEEMDSISVLFAYHSTKIDNDRVTYEATRAIFECDRDIVELLDEITTLAAEIAIQCEATDEEYDKIFTDAACFHDALGNKASFVDGNNCIVRRRK